MPHRRRPHPRPGPFHYDGTLLIGRRRPVCPWRLLRQIGSPRGARHVDEQRLVCGQGLGVGDAGGGHVVCQRGSHTCQEYTPVWRYRLQMVANRL